MSKTAFGLMTKCANWPQYYLDYIGYNKSNWIIQIKDIKLELRPNSVDKWIVAENLILDCYEFGKLKNLKIDQVLDIGANIGAFTVPAAKYLGAKEVIAFEPNPANFRMLKKNVELNKLSTKVELHNSAVSLGNQPTIKLFEGNDYGSSSTFHPSDNFIEVANREFKSLSERISTNSILKMDIEGGELEIFTSENLSILKKFKFIVLEFHHFLKTHDRLEFENFLVRSGFEFKNDDIIYLISNKE